jgi:hypothetical protein
MEQTSKYVVGLRFGLLTGLIYIILLFIRYHFFGSSALYFGLVAIMAYCGILVMYLLTGIARKKQLGGNADLKEIFQSIFIAILIAELFYILFNLIYFKFVNPAFWENFKASSLELYKKMGLTRDQIDEQMKSFKDTDQATKPIGLFKGYGTSVVVDSVFGLIFALILRKKKPVFESLLKDPKL